MSAKIPWTLLLLLLTLAAGAWSWAEEADLPVYRIVPEIAGEITAIGSDTMVELMTYWSEGLCAQYPKVIITVDQKGSNTAPPALLDGSAQLGPMSRPMNADEISVFTKRYGYPPTEFVVAIDALAIFVHRDNPVAGFSLTQVKTIFGTEDAPGKMRLTTWADVGSSLLGTRAINTYGRNGLSGTQVFFRQHVLGGADFAPGLQEKPTSNALIQVVASDPQAVAYCGASYATAGVRVVPVARDGGRYILPSPETCISGTYPIARKLYIYVNKPPGRELPIVVREFLRFVLSRTGQEVVRIEGFYSLPLEQVQAMLRQLDP